MLLNPKFKSRSRVKRFYIHCISSKHSFLYVKKKERKEKQIPIPQLIPKPHSTAVTILESKSYRIPQAPPPQYAHLSGGKKKKKKERKDKKKKKLPNQTLHQCYLPREDILEFMLGDIWAKVCDEECRAGRVVWCGGVLGGGWLG